MNQLTSFVIAASILITPILRAQTPLAAQIAEVSAYVDQINRLHASVLDKARAWRSLAALQLDAARYTESDASFAQAIQLFQNAPDANQELAEAIDGRGALEMETTRFAAARASLEQARTMRLVMKDTLGVARSDVHLANLDLAEHNYEQAHALATEALASFDHDPNTNVLDKNSAMIAISLALCKLNRSGEALPVLRNLVMLARRSYPDDSVPVGFAFYLLGYAEQKNHDLLLANANMKRGIEGMEKSMGWGHPIFVEALSQYATLLRETGRAPEAQQLEARANQLRSRARQQGAANSNDLASLP
jgi:tetratricopeptide (TPR) repeat protein